MKTLVIMWFMFSLGIVVMAFLNKRSYERGYKQGLKDGWKRNGKNKRNVENVGNYSRN